MDDNKTFVGEPMTAYAGKTFSIHEAKTNFSKLVKRAEAGETIFVGAYGKPTVAIIAADQRKINAKLREEFIGCMKGKIKFHEGWENWTDEELNEMFYKDDEQEKIINK